MRGEAPTRSDASRRAIPIQDALSRSAARLAAQWLRYLSLHHRGPQTDAPLAGACRPAGGLERRGMAGGSQALPPQAPGDLPVRAPARAAPPADATPRRDFPPPPTFPPEKTPP